MTPELSIPHDVRNPKDTRVRLMRTLTQVGIALALAGTATLAKDTSVARARDEWYAPGNGICEIIPDAVVYYLSDPDTQLWRAVADFEEDVVPLLPTVERVRAYKGNDVYWYPKEEVLDCVADQAVQVPTQAGEPLDPQSIEPVGPWGDGKLILLGSCIVYLFGWATSAFVLRSEYERQIRRRLQHEYDQLTSQLRQEHDNALANLKTQARIQHAGARLLLRGRNGSLTSGLTANPDIHSAFAPAITVSVSSDKLVGYHLPLVFRLVDASDPEHVLREVRKSHRMTRGVNVVYPPEPFQLKDFDPGRYLFKIGVAGDIFYNNTPFRVGTSLSVMEVRVGENGVIDFDPEAAEGYGVKLQDLIDLVG